MEFKIKEKIEKGYSLDLGKLIEDCFEIFKKIFLIAGLGYLLVAIVFCILYFFLLMAVFGISNISNWVVEMQNIQTGTTYMVFTFLLTVILTALYAPINAGFLKLCLLAKKNQELNLGVLFDYYKGKYVKDIIIGSIIISLTTVVFNTLFQMIDFSIFGFLVQIVITVFTVLFLPLVIFANQNYSDALKNSVSLVAKNPFYIALALLIAFIGIFVGLIAICLGVIFTAPIYLAMNFSIYDNVVGFEESSVIDEIGQIEE